MKVAAAVLLAYLLIALAPARSHYRPFTEHNRVHAINHAFCSGNVNGCWRGNEALRVAYCESGPSLWPYARSSGGHYGMFQFGAFARARYGFRWQPWFQARAAYRYFVDSGRDWSPWSCKP
jgi:hypothetical protein